MTQQPTFNVKAAGGTIVVHVLLFLLFFFVKYGSPTAAPVEELGMEVNLGTDEDGSGTEQPMAMGDPAAVRTEQPVAENPPSTESGKSVLDSEDPEAPAVPTSTTPNTRVNTNENRKRTRATERRPNPTNNTRQQPQDRPRYVYQGATGRGGNGALSDARGGSEGNTSGNGDRGVPGGTPGANNYTGNPGPGTGGISHTLTGRDISPRQFEAEFNEGGRVVIRVTVDKQGNIISKTVKSSPSPALTRLALQKLGQARFSPSTDAAPQQFGVITIVFKSRS